MTNEPKLVSRKTIEETFAQDDPALHQADDDLRDDDRDIGDDDDDRADNKR